MTREARSESMREASRQMERILVSEAEEAARMTRWRRRKLMGRFLDSITVNRRKIPDDKPKDSGSE